MIAGVVTITQLEMGTVGQSGHMDRHRTVVAMARAGAIPDKTAERFFLQKC